jgi:sarcosine oxidase, subunit gamma
MPETRGACWHTMPPCSRFALRVELAEAARALAMNADATALPLAVTPCRSNERGAWAALWLGPDEQLLLGPRDGAEACAARVALALQAVPHSLVDISHRQGAIELAGPYAADLINSGCPLDLGLAAFPVGACTRTVFARSDVVLWRRGRQEFRLEVWRSFLPYVLGLLAQAEPEFLD